MSLSQIRNLACDPGAWIPAKVQRLLADPLLIRIGGDSNLRMRLVPSSIREQDRESFGFQVSTVK